MADFPKKTQVSEADPRDKFQSGNGPISIEPKSGPIESLKPADPVASFTLNRTVRTGVEDQLHVALDNMPGALVYTDEDLNIVVCNDRFKEMYRVPVELLQPGRPYPDFLRFLAENGYYGKGDVGVLVAQRIESLRDPSGQSFEDQTPDGRWYRILRRRTSAGGAVTVMTDITEEKQARESSGGQGSAATYCARQHAGRTRLHG